MPSGDKKKGGAIAASPRSLNEVQDVVIQQSLPEKPCYDTFPIIVKDENGDSWTIIEATCSKGNLFADFVFTRTAWSMPGVFLRKRLDKLRNIVWTRHWPPIKICLTRLRPSSGGGMGSDYSRHVALLC